MKFTVGWLKDYLEFDSSITDLCNKLTDIGLEVEKVVDPSETLKNFKIAKILRKKPHPNADKLSLCEVFDGNENLKIVCGAKNVRENLITVLAPVGTIIFSGRKNEFKISKSKIRGEESNGMLCSEEELGLSDFSEGIIELDENFKIGDKYSQYINDEDIMIEVAITPNRVDCAGVYGIARDLFAADFGKLKKKKITKIESTFETKITLVNKLKDTDCPNFSIRLIKNVENKNSAANLVKRFEKTGLKVISSLVDVTNFITVDFCRPLHVFDYDKIEGSLTIRHSKKGEKFLGLDDESYELDEGMIVICDDSGVISLAGILGGKKTACDENTKNVLIESAYFLPASIIKSGRKLNIQSDARYRFERGIDPDSVDEGIEYATEMILNNCGGEPGSIVNDSEKIVENNKIQIERMFFERVLGVEIPNQFIHDKLIKIGCDLEGTENLVVTPPSWRSDLKIKEDLVEEVARLYGLEKIPSIPLNFQNNTNKKNLSDIQVLRNKIKKLLVSRNIFEIITWSFTDEKIQKLFGEMENFVKITNPISSELSCMRSNLLPNIISAIKKNINKNFDNFSFFELGPVFLGSEPHEQFDNICVVRSGKINEKSWIGNERNLDFFDIKADLSSVLNCLEMEIGNFDILRASKPYYHPGKSASLLISDKVVGFFGEVSPIILNSLDIKNKLVAFELNLTELLKFYKKKEKSKNPLIASQYQASKRDFSFELDKDIFSLEIIKLIKTTNNKLIKDVKVFDSYEGEKISENKKAVGFEVTIQSNEKTLTDDEINKISEEIILIVKNKYDAKLR